MLQCNICGGKLVMDGSGEKAICSQCGVEYSKEVLQKLIVSAQTQTSGSTENSKADMLAQNGETYTQLKEYDKAEKVYAQMIDTYPQDWRGWWGTFQTQVKFGRIQTYDRLEAYAKFADNAIQLSGAYRGIIQKQYDELCTKLQAEKVQEAHKQWAARKEYDRDKAIRTASLKASGWKRLISGLIISILGFIGIVSGGGVFCSFGISGGGRRNYCWHQKFFRCK